MRNPASRANRGKRRITRGWFETEAIRRASFFAASGSNSDSNESEEKSPSNIPMAPPDRTVLAASRSTATGSFTWLNNVCATTASNISSARPSEWVSPDSKETRSEICSVSANLVAAATRCPLKSMPVTFPRNRGRFAIARATTPVPHPISKTWFASSMAIASRYSSIMATNLG